MPFNGSGTFLRVRSWIQDAAANIRIRADRHDSEDDNFAQGLSQCITKDGQTTITANLPMANYRHTNVGAATAATHYARYDQVQLGKAVWSVAGGTADAITASYSPNTVDPVDGQLYYVRTTAANTSTTPTFSPDWTTARTIVKYGNQALDIGDIAGAGHELILRYRLSDTKYELLNPKAPPVPDAEDISYDNAISGLSADNVQDAIDEIATPMYGGSPARGDTLYRGASTWARLSKGTPGQVLTMGQDDPQWSNSINLQAPVATTSGTSVNISTAIPVGVKKVTVNINGLSTSGTSVPIIQIGGASFEVSGYVGTTSAITGGNASDNASGGIPLGVGVNHSAAAVYSGVVRLELMDEANNIWCWTVNLGRSDIAGSINGAGRKTLSGSMERLRIATLSGTETLDAGAASISWEF